MSVVRATERQKLVQRAPTPRAELDQFRIIAGQRVAIAMNALTTVLGVDPAQPPRVAGTKLTLRTEVVSADGGHAADERHAVVR